MGAARGCPARVWVSGVGMDDERAVRALLAQHEALFPNGDVARLAANYRNPVAVFLPSGLRVEQTLADTVMALRRLWDVARGSGATKVRHRILALRGSTPGRMVALVEWTYLDAGESTVGVSRLRYFLARQNDGSLRIEMLEYELHAFPDAAGDMHRPPQPGILG